jgi:hypothetical protein
MGPLSAVSLAFWALMIFIAPNFGWWGPISAKATAWISLIVFVLVLVDVFFVGSVRWIRTYRVRGPRAPTETSVR